MDKVLLFSGKDNLCYSNLLECSANCLLKECRNLYIYDSINIYCDDFYEISLKNSHYKYFETLDSLSNRITLAKKIKMFPYILKNILTALYDIHSLGYSYGEIKSNDILCTTLLNPVYCLLSNFKNVKIINDNTEYISLANTLYSFLFSNDRCDTENNGIKNCLLYINKLKSGDVSELFNLLKIQGNPRKQILIDIKIPERIENTIKILAYNFNKNLNSSEIINYTIGLTYKYFSKSGDNFETTYSSIMNVIMISSYISRCIITKSKVYYNEVLGFTDKNYNYFIEKIVDFVKILDYNIFIDNSVLQNINKTIFESVIKDNIVSKIKFNKVGINYIYISFKERLCSLFYEYYIMNMISEYNFVKMIIIYDYISSLFKYSSFEEAFMYGLYSVFIERRSYNITFESIISFYNVSSVEIDNLKKVMNMVGNYINPTTLFDVYKSKCNNDKLSSEIIKYYISLSHTNVSFHSIIKSS